MKDMTYLSQLEFGYGCVCRITYIELRRNNYLQRAKFKFALAYGGNDKVPTADLFSTTP